MFNEITKENHNIMCLVGNGFDIAALTWLNQNMKKNNKVNSGFGYNVLSTYSDFFNYLFFTKDKELDPNKRGKRYNRIYRKMKERKNVTNSAGNKESLKDPKYRYIETRNNQNNWCDFECIVDELAQYLDPTDEDGVQKLEEELLVFQREFSTFLNNLLTSEKIVEFDRLVSEHNLAYNSLSRFLSDLKDSSEDTDNYDPNNPPNFPYLIRTSDKLNFLFVDFCYTMLLDSYINLDRLHFNVSPYKTSDNNFKFNPNPRNSFKENQKLGKQSFDVYDKKGNIVSGYSDLSDWIYNTEIVTDVVHPHGIQDVPRSILFGTENNVFLGDKDNRWRFVKSKWAQDEKRYIKDINNTQLFIIFGMSLSTVDGWWMSEIYERLLCKDEEISEENHPELLIYNYISDPQNDKIPEIIKNRFIEACVYVDRKIRDKKDDETVKSRIYVINYKDGENVFLGFNNSAV